MVTKTLTAKNDTANSELVIRITLLSLVIGAVVAGAAIFLATQGWHEIVLAVVSLIFVASWVTLTVLTYHYNRVVIAVVKV